LKNKLKISVAQQRLELFEQKADGSLLSIASYPISSSKFGLGTEPGSNKTPLGNFVIEEKIGHGAPLQAIFKSRRATGDIAPLGGDEDHILTRILWLGGLDPENSNTRERFIYIHGTAQEELLGRPASHGCIRMGNDHLLELFDRVAVGDRVEIRERF
jgi:lipoprotein-anchoring transpeptidase ErfK/SrfK